VYKNYIVFHMPVVRQPLILTNNNMDYKQGVFILSSIYRLTLPVATRRAFEVSAEWATLVG